MPQQSTTSRLQFVRLCECGCQQPTLLAPHNDVQRGRVKGQPQRFLANHQAHGERHPKYKGGRTEHRGYVLVSRPDHPHADRDGYVPEHRLVMEAHLGRYLTPAEVVHHRDHNRGRNTLDNLQLFANNQEHMRAGHGREKRWARQHDACVQCGGTERPHAMHGLCRACALRDTYHSNATFREGQLAQKRERYTSDPAYRADLQAKGRMRYAARLRRNAS